MTYRLKVEKELTKLYYSISEVAEMFDVSNSLIRYWETEFKSLKPKKSRKGDRQYTVKDIRVLERIYTLVKERGFTLEGAKKEMRNKSVKPSIQNEAVINELLELRQKITKLKERL